MGRTLYQRKQARLKKKKMGRPLHLCRRNMRRLPTPFKRQRVPTSQEKERIIVMHNGRTMEPWRCDFHGRKKFSSQQLAIAPVMPLCKQLSSLFWATQGLKYDALVRICRLSKRERAEIDKALSGRSHSLQRASPSVTKLYLAFLEAGFVYTNCVSGCLGMGWGCRVINRHSADNMDARSMWNDSFHGKSANNFSLYSILLLMLMSDFLQYDRSGIHLLGPFLLLYVLINNRFIAQNEKTEEKKAQIQCAKGLTSPFVPTVHFFLY